MEIKLPKDQFIMNDRIWTIKEINQEVFWGDDKKEQSNNDYFLGRTKFSEQEIWLYKDLTLEQKRKTLIHELVHCYRGMYFTFNNLDGQDEELWCDIISNSHDIIHKIVEGYFGNKMS